MSFEVTDEHFIFELEVENKQVRFITFIIDGRHSIKAKTKGQHLCIDHLNSYYGEDIC